MRSSTRSRAKSSSRSVTVAFRSRTPAPASTPAKRTNSSSAAFAAHRQARAPGLVLRSYGDSASCMDGASPSRRVRKVAQSPRWSSVGRSIRARRSAIGCEISAARGDGGFDGRHCLAFARNRFEPTPAIFGASIEQAEEKFLHPVRDLAGLAATDRLAVDRADWRDLGGGAAHEKLVAEIEIFARNVAFDDFDAVRARERHQRIA